jgi:flagellar basal-body rod protein FlgF
LSDIYQIASIGMLDGRQRLEAISLNAANASLPGYRRHIAVGQGFEAAMSRQGEHGLPGEASVHDRELRWVGPLQHRPDLRAGAMQLTGRPLDVAIDGEDHFFALTDGAKVWLTRSGALGIDRDGILVGERGLRVLGVQGDIKLPGGEVSIAADGTITQGGEKVATLQLFDATDRSQLAVGPGTLLDPVAGTSPVEASAVRVRSGTLEASNTDAGREMVSLVAISRQFESLARVVQGYDELLGRVIQRIGEI